MGERSDEVTERREPGSTDDLLEETDRLLAGEEPGRDESVDLDPSRSDPSATPASAEAADDAADGSSWRSRLTTTPSLERYFSPRTFLTRLLAVGAGLLVGSTAIPIAGRAVGVFGAAFVVGLLASRRSYLETVAAGGSAGAAAALVSSLGLVAVGSGQAVVAIGAGTGLLASLVGYYLGRDLRDGLLRDV